MQKDCESQKINKNRSAERIILSADIRSFTTLAERMRPDDVFAFLNEYLEFVGPIIRSNGGFIAKYEGDGFFALFPTGPEAAVRAAVQLQTAIASRNRNRLLRRNSRSSS